MADTSTPNSAIPGTTSGASGSSSTGASQSSTTPIPTASSGASGSVQGATGTSAGAAGSTPSGISVDRTIPTSPKQGMSTGKKVGVFAGSCIVIVLVIIAIIVGFFVWALKKAPDVVNSVVDETKKEVTNSLEDSGNQRIAAGIIDPAAQAILAEVRMADSITADFEPDHLTSVFRPADKTFYCTVRTKSLDAGTVIKANWYYIDQDQFIQEKEYPTEAGVNQIAFNLTRPEANEWPVGRYEVRIYVNDALGMTVPFEVQ